VGPPSDSTDDLLCARAAEGSEAAMAELYSRYRPRILGYALRLTGDRELAEDVLAAAFSDFLEHLDSYRPSGRLAAYLFRIARNRLVDELRIRGRGTPLDGGDGEPLPIVDPAAGPAETAAGDELRRRAADALAQLPAHLREVVELRLRQGLDFAAIGSVTGVGEATARSRMRYALAALRDMLGEAAER
jgi:RNA polymerase sigma-70 factor (ECF subfamily)